VTGSGRTGIEPGLRAVAGPVAAVLERVRRNGAEPHVIEKVASKPGLIRALGAELGFPDWVGANWDALYDILQNLYWRPDGPQVVVWLGPERLRDADPDVYAMALRVLRDSVEASLPTPRPLTILLTREE
jgi:RNAse (barnase) inhibitor barstar